MAVRRSGNVALDDARFKLPMGYTGELMTHSGTMQKTTILLILAGVGAVLSVVYANILLPYYIGFIILGAVVGFINIFKSELSHILSPVYAIIEGVVIGLLSLVFEAMYPGIVVQAVALTFGVFAMMLLLYQQKIIKVTPGFKMGLLAATGGVMIIYLIGLIGHFMGMDLFIHSIGGPLGIIISLVIVSIAAFNLILDFDYIDRAIEHGAPKNMEWYGAFGLIVTLVWLYIEILRLISKFRE